MRRRPARCRRRPARCRRRRAAAGRTRRRCRRRPCSRVGPCRRRPRSTGRAAVRMVGAGACGEPRALCTGAGTVMWCGLPAGWEACPAGVIRSAALGVQRPERRARECPMCESHDSSRGKCRVV
eukprot:5622883-Prymnesium_polylepis.1